MTNPDAPGFPMSNALIKNAARQAPHVNAGIITLNMEKLSPACRRGHTIITKNAAGAAAFVLFVAEGLDGVESGRAEGGVETADHADDDGHGERQGKHFRRYDRL